MRFGEFEIDTAAARLLRGGVQVRLEPRTFHLLVFLLENRRRLVTKNELLEQVWGGAFVTENALDRAVARLRHALGDDVRSPTYVETVPGMGYRFLADVESGSHQIAGGERGDDATVPAPLPAAGATRTVSRRRVPATVLAASIGGLLLALLALLAAPRSDDVPGETPIEVEQPIAAGVVVPRQLTSSQDFEFGPTFSPDGSALAYTSNTMGSMAVWVRPLAAGGRPMKLSPDGARLAAWSPDGRWIAYDSYRGIWIVPPTGGAARQLTERGASPAWSPDGSRLVFQLLGEGVDINSFPAQPPSTLWTVALDGGPPRQITQADEPAGGHGQPAFSPDGRRIAFVTGAGRRPGELWTMAAEGGDLRLVLTGCGCRDPVFARDGRSLYYTDSVDSLPGLWQVALDEGGGAGGPPRPLHQAPLRFVAASPDGRRLAASRHELKSNLWSLAVAPDTGVAAGEPGPLTRDTNYRNMYPVASPDGRRIAFLVARAGNRSELWCLDLANGDRTLLTDTTAPVGGVGPVAGKGWPAWSADSRQLYFVDGPELRRIDVETLRAEPVLRTGLHWHTPAVAPDGKGVAFSLPDEAGVGNVWTVDLAGTAVQVTREPRGAFFPTWSPDGRHLAIEVRRADGLHCAVLALEDGELRVLTSGADFPGGREECFTGGWSPDGDKTLMARRPAEDPIERWDVWWASRTTGELRRLTERPPHPGREFVRYPTWSPSGDRVYFELAQSSADLWLFELPGS